VIGVSPTLHGDPKECSKNAFRCRKLAERATTAKAKEIFSSLATTWLKVAVELEKSHALMDDLSPSTADGD
jgi:hypothetical protein